MLTQNQKPETEAEFASLEHEHLIFPDTDME